ncbi:MAG: hypothetical protein BWX87_02750 [Bacteroidetes bacterium ADurb.Bin123]|jgi:DNA-binding transcriptional regulator YiaG|nr:MAG: hypothetical protein BWX87_02750 [Bacteroidetes bacterium ADurb.Bin123]
MRSEKQASPGADIVAKWQSSGLTQIEFAQSNNLSVHTLRYWLYKKRNPSGESPAFIELRNILNHNSVFLRYPNGVEMHLPAGTPVAALKALINL